jgi:gliding motility-associated-like protein
MTSTAGSYSVTVSDDSGCTGESIVDVSVGTALLPKIEGALALCEGSEGMLSTGLFAHYLWSTGDTTQAIQIVNGGMYVVTVSDQNGCIGMDSVVVEVTQELQVEISGPTIHCAGTEIELSTGLSGSHIWSTGAGEAVVFIENPGTYSVTVTDISGCSGVDSVEITEGLLPLADISIDKTTICAGTEVAISVIGIGDLTLNSDFQITEVGSGMYTGNPQESGSVLLSAMSECGVDSTEVFIEVATLPVIDAGEDVAIQSGQQVTLGATGGVAYEWFPGINISCTACPDPVVTPDSTSTYFVIGTDANGCTGQDSVTVYVFIDIDLDPVNVITPNGDGINDNFVIHGVELFPNSALYVFNRWGEPVYESLSYQNDWEGTYNGSLLPAGSYLYHLRVSAFGQVEEIKGTITIVLE